MIQELRGRLTCITFLRVDDLLTLEGATEVKWIRGFATREPTALVESALGGAEPITQESEAEAKWSFLPALTSEISNMVQVGTLTLQRVCQRKGRDNESSHLKVEEDGSSFSTQNNRSGYFMLIRVNLSQRRAKINLLDARAQVRNRCAEAKAHVNVNELVAPVVPDYGHVACLERHVACLRAAEKT